MDIDEIAARLIDCEQSLASLPETEHRLERALAENEDLRAELDSTRDALRQLVASPSWRITAPLRRLRRMARRSR